MNETAIWGSEPYFRLFISHVNTYKKQAELLKRNLEEFGISGFVAHSDIEANYNWQDVIEKALSTADGLVTLMTPDFHSSDWTDQEIGYALGRKIEIVSIKLGKAPYGFIGKQQALACDIETDCIQIPLVLIRSNIKMVENSHSFDCSNQLAKLLPEINRIEPNQINKLIEVFNANRQVRESVGFAGGTSKKVSYLGLAKELFRITGIDFSDQLKIEE